MNNAPIGMGGQMADCMGGMMWGMGLLGLLVAVLLVLGIAALTKYLLFASRRRDDHG